MEKIIVLNDMHIPFHDKKTLKLLIRFLKDFKPHKIFLLGDIIDFYTISRFDKDPSRQLTLQEEVDATIKILIKLRSLTKEIRYLKGNHEDRLRKYIYRNAKEIWWVDGLNLKSILNLDEIGIKYIDNRWFKYKGILFSHMNKASAYGGYTAKNIGQRVLTNVIHGHSHRSGKVRFAKNIFIDNGCLCNLNADYLETPSDWTQAFTIVKIIKGKNFIEQIDINDHKFIYGGRLYK